MEVSEEQEELFFGDLLKQFRGRKKLTQQQFAEQIGVSREAVSLWERGYYKPESEAILYETGRILGLNEQEQQQLFEAYTVTAVATSFHTPPFERNPYFTGRDSQLSELHKLLMRGKQVALTQAISGLGGIGKTQLALEYAYHYQRSYHDIFWTTADTYESLMASYIRLAVLLRLAEYDEPDQSKVKMAVERWLSKHTGWLLILDNIEDLSLAQQFVPVARQGAVLLTTRRQVTESVAQALELELLPENESILFLLKRAKVLTLKNMSLDDASDHDIAAARTITQKLGNLPLALDQAGAYILEAKCSLSDYLVLFEKHQVKLLRRRAGEEIPTDHPDSVAATFTLNFQQVQQRSEVAGELLRLCAYLAPDAIAEEIITQGAAHLGPLLAPVAADAFLLNQAIEVLRAYSLIARDPLAHTLSMHRLVQMVLRDALADAIEQQWMQRAVLAVNETIPEMEFAQWMAYERCVPHALLCATWIEHLQLVSPEAARLLNQIGSYLRERARYSEAELLLNRSLAIQEQELGPEHPDTATCLNNLALLEKSQGRYAEAETLFQRTLFIREKQLGPTHPETAASLNNLAELHQAQGRYAEAESLYQRALSILEKQLGTAHPFTAGCLNNLALLYESQGRYAEAESLYQRVLRIAEEKLGPTHPETAACLNNLALLYESQGRYEEAEPLYQRALFISEQQLGPTHPETAASLNNLANLYQAQGRYEEAEPLYQRALRIQERALGPEHSQVAYPLHNLARLYSDQGKYAEAEPLYQHALHIWEQQFGPQHPNVAYPLNGLANLYRDQGKDAQAEPLYRRALHIRELCLGKQHPETAEILHDLAIFREAQGHHQEALSLYQRALAMRERDLGLHHPKTEATRQRFIALSQQSGQ